MLWILLGTASSYFIGSVPTAYIFGRILKGIDIRKFGSGNVGATNVWRVLGKGPGLAVLVLDMLKGLAATVFVADWIIPKVPAMDSQALRALFGLSSICGHNWTIFLNFKGGKGVATTFGVLFALAVKIPPLRVVFGLLFLTWLVVFLLTRIVSLASVLTGMALPIYMALGKQPRVLTAAGIIIAIFILLRHKSNLQRLIQGNEHRI